MYNDRAGNKGEVTSGFSFGIIFFKIEILCLEQVVSGGVFPVEHVIDAVIYD